MDVIDDVGLGGHERVRRHAYRDRNHNQGSEGSPDTGSALILRN
jgi:hypothetical protein